MTATPSKLRILYAATYYVDRYVRQEVVIKALQAQPNCEVTVLLVNRPGWWRYIQFLWKFIQQANKNTDVIILGWRSYELIPVIRWLTRKPLVVDMFLSVSETLIEERRRFSPSSLVGRLARWLDRTAVSSADTLFCDTETDRQFIIERFKADPERAFVVYVGADTTIYRPTSEPWLTSKTITVLYYGTYLPLHGVETIVQAANLLRHDERVSFVMIGDGPSRRAAEHLASPDARVDWKGRMSQEQLANAIQAADICLGGPFADLPKARRVITTKTYQFLAMAKPVIVGDTPANHELLTPGQDCLMVPLSDPSGLAEAIRQLASDANSREKLKTGALATAKQIKALQLSQVTDLLRRYVPR